MKNTIKKIGEVVRHNQFIMTAIVIGVVMVVWVYGCASTTKSPWKPEEKLTREELTAEIELMNTKIKTAYADLEKQELFKQELFKVGVIMAEGGTVNPIGVGIGLLGILGIGAVADNRKKDSVIKTLKGKTV